MLVGCGSSESSPNPVQTHATNHPLVLIGVDGMEWDVVCPMLHAGRLPNIARLMEQGAFGMIDSVVPTLSPIIWTSIATGKGQEKHGIHGFLNKEMGEDESANLYTSLDRRTKAYWNILTDHDRRAAVIGWWITYPVEQINGVMVAQTNTSSPMTAKKNSKMLKGTLYENLEGQVHPAHRQDEILSLIPQIDTELQDLTRQIFGEMPQTKDPVAHRLWEKCLWAVRADAIYHAVGLRLLEDEPSFDTFAIYFGGTDVIGHRFWRYLQPDLYAYPPTAEQIREFADVIPAYYAHIDRIIGGLVDAAPDPCNFMIVSDHGFHAVNTKGRYTADLTVRQLKSGGHPDAPPGFFLAHGPDIRQTEVSVALTDLTRDNLPSVGSVMDIAPTVLALMGLPLGRDMDGNFMKNLLKVSFLESYPIAWVQTHTSSDWFASRQAGAAENRDIAQRMEQLRSLGYIGGQDEN